MPALVAQPASRGDVARHILSPVLLGDQMFRGAAQWRDRSGAEPQGFQFVRGGIPHQQAAVAAASLLGVESVGSQAL